MVLKPNRCKTKLVIDYFAKIEIAFALLVYMYIVYIHLRRSLAVINSAIYDIL